LARDFWQFFQGFTDALAQQRHIDAGLRQQGPSAAALLIEQGREQMRGFDDIVVAADGQRLGVGQRLLETRGEFVHTHGRDSGSEMRPNRDASDVRAARAVSRRRDTGR
jgi:GNAT superfamily N-acetyltransferase